MKKKVGVLATLFAALFAVIQPAAAQDRRDWNRERFDHDRSHFVYRPAPYGPARVYRQEVFRDRAWREREVRERCDRYGYRVPGPVVGFQYYGR